MTETDISPISERNCLHVTKLTRNVNKEHINEIFSNYGTIENIELQIDKRNGLSKGIALIHFQSLKDAEQAMTYLNGGQIDGSFIEISYYDDEIKSKNELKLEKKELHTNENKKIIKESNEDTDKVKSIQLSMQSRVVSYAKSDNKDKIMGRNSTITRTNDRTKLVSTTSTTVNTTTRENKDIAIYNPRDRFGNMPYCKDKYNDPQAIRNDDDRNMNDRGFHTSMDNRNIYRGQNIDRNNYNQNASRYEATPRFNDERYSNTVASTAMERREYRGDDRNQRAPPRDVGRAGVPEERKENKITNEDSKQYRNEMNVNSSTAQMDTRNRQVDSRDRGNFNQRVGVNREEGPVAYYGPGIIARPTTGNDRIQEARGRSRSYNRDYRFPLKDNNIRGNADDLRGRYIPKERGPATTNVRRSRERGYRNNSRDRVPIIPRDNRDRGGYGGGGSNNVRERVQYAYPYNNRRRMDNSRDRRGGITTNTTSMNKNYDTQQGRYYTRRSRSVSSSLPINPRRRRNRSSDSSRSTSRTSSSRRSRRSASRSSSSRSRSKRNTSRSSSRSRSSYLKTKIKKSISNSSRSNSKSSSRSNSRSRSNSPIEK